MGFYVLVSYLFRYGQPTIRLPMAREGKDYTSYTPLVLDAASGCGKTQLAFTMLVKGFYEAGGGKNEKRCQLVYANLGYHSSSTEGTQTIYLQLKRLTGLYGTAFKLVRAAALETMENPPKDGGDAFAVGHLYEQVQEIGRGETLGKASALARLLQWLVRTRMWCEKSPSGSLQSLRFPGCNIKSPLSKVTALKGVILFVDEALPGNASTLKQEAISPQELLRFFRNLGIAAGMRVVLAGTAATAANMLPVSSARGKIESCLEPTDEVWMEVLLLDPARIKRGARRNKVDADTAWLLAGMTQEVVTRMVEGQSAESRQQESLAQYLHHIKTALAYERGQLAVEVGIAAKVSQGLQLRFGLLSTLAKVGHRLVIRKDVSDESKAAWLLGPFLKGKVVLQSQFSKTAQYLVRNHFFEPACLMKAGKHTPYLGGIGHIQLERMVGPVRLSITRLGEDAKRFGRVWWQLIVMSKKAKFLGEQMAPEFQQIVEAITCEQHCLATEPLLAVALAHAHRFGDDNRWLEAVLAIQEPRALLRQREVAICGIDYKMMVYATGQEASGGLQGEKDISLRQCIEHLYQLLTNRNFVGLSDDQLRSLLRKSVSANSETSNFTLTAKFQDLSTQLQQSAQRVLDARTIPFLVPASSEEDLLQHYSTESKLLGMVLGADDDKGRSVGGLVYTKAGDRVDIEAYQVRQDGLKKIWRVEVKAKSAQYTMTTAKNDLGSKLMCSNEMAAGEKPVVVLVGFRSRRANEFAYDLIHGYHCFIMLLYGGMFNEYIAI